MPFDSLFLISIGGMVLAVLVIAIFFRRTEADKDEDLPAAVAGTPFEDDLALLRRYSCPECGTVLRQEAALNDPRRPNQMVQAETGLPTGSGVCPKCGNHLNISWEEKVSKTA